MQSRNPSILVHNVSGTSFPLSKKNNPLHATSIQWSHHHLAIGFSADGYDVDLWTWSERQTVLSQDGLPTSKCEEFFQPDGTGIRDVVYGVGAWETY